MVAREFTRLVRIVVWATRSFNLIFRSSLNLICADNRLQINPGPIETQLAFDLGQVYVTEFKTSTSIKHREMTGYGDSSRLLETQFNNRIKFIQINNLQNLQHIFSAAKLLTIGLNARVTTGYSQDFLIPQTG